MPIALNNLIDNRYVIYRYVASGGMAEIYEAHDKVLNKPVALKFIKDKYLEDSASIEQFKNEARYTSIFNHPNVMKIYNVGEYESRPYVSYELLKGKTLKSILDNRGKLSFDECLNYMNQILLGSEMIHSRGILHNDFKPDNLYLLFDGTIRICDFGAASHITNKEKSQILGTANYLAPEVIVNKKYTVQSDIYSLGIIFYELLTGELPFEGSNTKEVLEAHASGSIVSIKGRCSYPNNEDIDYVINKAINRFINNRYKNDREFLNDLIKIKNHTPIVKKSLLQRIFK